MNSMRIGTGSVSFFIICQAPVTAVKYLLKKKPRSFIVCINLCQVDNKKRIFLKKEVTAVFLSIGSAGELENGSQMRLPIFKQESLAHCHPTQSPTT